MWQAKPHILICPVCNEWDELKKHTSYFKYLYSETIRILVVKCERCSKFHAVIPSFSLPGTSLGTAEVEDFVKKRKLNKSRREAGEQLLEKGISFKHLKNIDKMFDRSQVRMQAIFPGIADDHLMGVDWCLHLVKREQTENLIYFLNHFCLSRKVNAVFCNRYNILLFNTVKVGVLNAINLDWSQTCGLLLVHAARALPVYLPMR